MPQNKSLRKHNHSKSMGCRKSVFRRNFIAIQEFLKREEKSQIDNLTYHLNELEKEEQTKPKVSRRKEVIKIREEINKIEIKKTIEEIKPRTGSLKR